MRETYEQNATQPNVDEWSLGTWGCECAQFEKQCPKDVLIFVCGSLRMDVSGTTESTQFQPGHYKQGHEDQCALTDLRWTYGCVCCHLVFKSFSFVRFGWRCDNFGEHIHIQSSCSPIDNTCHLMSSSHMARPPHNDPPASWPS